METPLRKEPGGTGAARTHEPPAEQDVRRATLNMNPNRAGSDRVAHPLFQEGGGGSTPTSALDLRVDQCSIPFACAMVRKWHSRLPEIDESNIRRNADYICFSASSGSVSYAVAIWSSPVARMLNDRKTLELRRFAIASDAPKNTATRTLRVMRMLVEKHLPHIVRLVTYQDTTVHSGTIYRAAGWVIAGTRTASEWSCESRPRNSTQAYGAKIRWEMRLGSNDRKPDVDAMRDSRRPSGSMTRHNNAERTRR